MKVRSPIARKKAPPPSKKPIRKRNAKRHKANQLRAYGPPERREWVKGQPCIICQRTPCDNAHTENEGKSRKGHYTTIVPLCSYKWAFRGHHQILDDMGRDRFEKYYEVNLKDEAAELETAWLAYIGGQPGAGEESPE